jgi:hypothetical protein
VRREEFDGVRPGEEKQELDYGRRMASAWLRRRTAGSELRRRTATPATSGTSDERGELERERRVRVGGRRERALLSPFIESRREKKSLPERRQWLAGLQVPSMASVTSQGINGESNGEEETVGVMILNATSNRTDADVESRVGTRCRAGGSTRGRRVWCGRRDLERGARADVGRGRPGSGLARAAGSAARLGRSGARGFWAAARSCLGRAGRPARVARRLGALGAAAAGHGLAPGRA